MRAADLEIRPATLDDAAIAADIDTNAHPHDPEDPQLTRHWRFTSLGAELRPPYRTAVRLDALYALVEEAARADATHKVTAWAWEHDALALGVLNARGFREERRERFWELDLVEGRERITTMAAESRERMRTEGITVLTLADDTSARPSPRRSRSAWTACGRTTTARTRRSSTSTRRWATGAGRR